ncbi:MAG: hypothetical protein RLZZ354_584 [Pseudomonadota bacterium]|jgi:hypothetical protein
MPTKRVIKQKQKQRQSVVVNVNLAKARARASAKKSGKGGGGGGGGGRGSVMMLPPPIYASPLDRLTPGMYNSQGQQIQQKSMEDLLKNFLSNQQTATNTGFRSLGGEPQLRSTSSFIPYDDSSDKSFRSLGSLSSVSSFPGSSSVSYNPSKASSSLSSFAYPSANATANSSSSSKSLTDYGSSNLASLSSLAYFPNQHSDSSLGSSTTSRYPILSSVGSSLSSTIPSSKNSLSRNYPDDISEITDPTYMSEDSSISKLMSTESQYDRALASPFSSDIPNPFQNEERSYLRQSEPDYEQNAPKFSDTHPESITEIVKRPPQKRPPVRMSLDEESISYQETPATRASGTPASRVNIIPFEDEMSSDSLSNYSRDSLNTNPFPKKIYNKIMGLNVIPFEDDSTFSSDSLNTNPFPKNMYNKMMG